MIKKGNKRAQQLFGMPFSVIFSIILIVVILVVAFFVIRHFLEFQRCSEAGLFFNDLEKEIKEAWESPFSDKVFRRTLPSKIEYVCIADISQDSGNLEEKEMIVDFRRYANQDSNVFLYPPQEVCAEGRSRQIDYLEESSFLCFEVDNKQVEIRIKRDYTGKVQLLKE